jgi:hypothetical protein
MAIVAPDFAPRQAATIGIGSEAYSLVHPI